MVLTVTEPQVWTMIGVFSALMFGMLTLVSTLFVRVVRTEIAGLRGELLGEMRGELGELGDVRAEIGGIRGELQSLHTKVDNLDRDVQLLMAREFGKDRD